MEYLAIRINTKRNNSMVKIFTSLFFSFSILMSKSFTVSDPPMIYIYHFVSYDTTEVIFLGEGGNQSVNKKIRLPLFNNSNILLKQDLLVGKAIDPKLVSAMVTSAVAENSHINIAGESIQNRIKTDNFIKLIKSSEYPKRTDFIFIGEINTIASQYEIDLKLIDVSTQKIVGSESFNLPFTSLFNLRSKINSVIKPLMDKIISPFVGYAFLRVDSTSREKIRWDEVYIRPLKVVVGNNITNTSVSDYKVFKTFNTPTNFMQSHGQILSQYLPTDYKMIADIYDNASFLEGDYRFKAYLKNNETPFETDFKIKSGDLNEIHVSLFYTPPPKDSDKDGIADKIDSCPDVFGVENDDPDKNGCPAAKLFGNIVFDNIWDGVGFELIRVDENADTLILFGKKDNNKLDISSEPYETKISKDKKSFSIIGLPLGNYVRNCWAITEEKFPGKHYLNLFSDRDSLNLDKAEVTVNTSIKNNKIKAGREIIIYFNPFTPDRYDEYTLYLDEITEPYTKTTIAGELHIVGFPTTYSGNLYINREGFEKAKIPIINGTKKSYHIADLNIQKGNDSERSKIGSIWKK